jgi:hypothetical protein
MRLMIGLILGRPRHAQHGFSGEACRCAGRGDGMTISAIAALACLIAMLVLILTA